MHIGKELIECPSGMPGAPAISISLKKILESEARQMEVASVTPDKAPELLQTFNKSWSDLHKMMVLLTYEKTVADKQTDRRRATVLLEVVPKTLEEKKLASSKDIRDAVLSLDAEYQDCLERSDQIHCVVEYLKGKLKSFENSFSSVKKIMSENTYNMLIGADRVSHGEISEASTVGNIEAPPSGFGKARY